jgi:hypothetical protein
MSTMGNDAFTLIWILGGAVLLVALFTLLGRRPASRRPARSGAPGVSGVSGRAQAARK